MARTSSYEMQLQESCRLVAAEVGIPASRWSLVYQSRSGRPQDPWLEPDILEHLRQLKQGGTTGVIIHPIGFLSDHMEVLYDLDLEAKQLCDALGLSMVRSRTVGKHRGFVRMLRELIGERVACARPTSAGSWASSAPATTSAPSTAACHPPGPRPWGRPEAV